VITSSRDERFEVFTAVSMKNGVFWDVPPCGSCKNRRSQIFVTLMKEALSYSETSVLTRGTRRNIQDDTILHQVERLRLIYGLHTLNREGTDEIKYINMKTSFKITAIQKLSQTEPQTHNKYNANPNVSLSGVGLCDMFNCKRPLRRPRRRCIDNIKMDLLVIGLNVMDRIGLAQDRYRWRAFVNSVMNLRVP
jgi:hypothetical protein